MLPNPFLGKRGGFNEKAEIRTRNVILQALNNSSIVYTNGESYVLTKPFMCHSLACTHWWIGMYVEELKDKREWESFLQASPEGTFFHSLKWKEVIQKSFPHSALYLTIRDANGRVVGICPGFLVSSLSNRVYYSMPHSDYGGPVIAEHYVEQASLSLRSFLRNFCSEKGIDYAKICFTNDKLEQSFNSGPRIGYVDTSKGIVEIDLKAKSSDYIWNKILSKNRRWKIRRYERDGFQAQEARSRSDLRDFYNIYCKNMKYIGASPHPYEFIENMWSLLYPENLRIWLVGKDRKTGGILVFKYGRRTYWSYAGIDRKQCGSVSVVPYLLWKEIKAAEEEGYRYVSLGGTPSDPRSPHYLQKIRMGGTYYQHKMGWYPFSITGRVLIQTRAKAILTWKAVRNHLPNSLKNVVTRKLSKF